MGVNGAARRLSAKVRVVAVRVKFTPVRTTALPGYPLPELAWSEMRYTAYSFVMPKFAVSGPRP